MRPHSNGRIADAAGDTGSQTSQVESIVVVGGGDNGLLTALALERFLDDVEITVIDDTSQIPPRVGKSTLTFFVKFLHGVLGIDGNRLLEEVPLGFKTSVYFEDWCGLDSFHSPLGWSIPVVSDSAVKGGLPDAPVDAFHEYLYRYREGEFSGIYEQLAETPGKTPWQFVMGRGGLTMEKTLHDTAYHINTEEFNQFLRTICRERHIVLRDDRVENIEIDRRRITSVHGSTGESYTADLYVDATGFKRILCDALDVPVIRPDIPVDSAVKTSVDIPLSDIVSATVVTTGSAGWFWQIDTMACRDLGYVYSSAHQSPADARQEFINRHDENIEADELVELSWTPGVVTTPWVNNCVAAGNSLAFLEPLHSFTLAAAASLGYYLSVLLAKYGCVNHPNLRTLFNDTALSKWQEIYNFQSMLYKHNPGSTPFWREARMIDADYVPQYHAYREGGFAAPDEWDRLTRTDTDQNPHYLYFLLFRSLGVSSPFLDDLDMTINPTVIDQVNAHSDSLEAAVDEYMTYDELYHYVGLDYANE